MSEAFHTHLGKIGYIVFVWNDQARRKHCLADCNRVCHRTAGLRPKAGFAIVKRRNPGKKQGI
jgi:hypothetical protein